MEYVIKLLEDELNTHKIRQGWFKNWLNSAKKEDYEYGIEHWTKKYERVSNAIPQIMEAIKYLKENTPEDDIIITGKCANCGVEYHIHKIEG
jgi:hypothetical protein